MEKTYANILSQGLEQYVKELASDMEADNENIRIVIKIEKGQLGAFLFNNSKFVRRIEMVELVKVLMG